jgi:hypothetical protein
VAGRAGRVPVLLVLALGAVGTRSWTRSRPIRRCAFRRVFATCGTVGTRSRAIRGSRCDDRVGCSASDGRCAPARPALHVSTRLLTFLPRALASTDCFRSFPLFAPPVNVLRWTRRKPSTIRRGAPDVVIGQSAADRAGARPYHFTCDAGSRGSASWSASLPRLRRRTQNYLLIGALRSECAA